jgi:hypothetical protein
MQPQCDDIPAPVSSNVGQHLNSPSSRSRWFVLAALLAMLLASTACTFLETAFQADSERWVRLNRLPTLTPTAISILAAVALVPEPASTPSTPVSAPVNSVMRGTAGWSFAATRLDTDPKTNLLMLHGELINETGSAQQLSFVSGAFYDEQGQISAESTFNYSPLEVVPPTGRVPFELAVYSPQRTDTYDLWATSSPSSFTPRQDFEFLNVTEQNKGQTRCLTGSLKNLGGGLKDYLGVVAVWYDEQDKVLKFSNHYETDLTELTGDQPLDFEVCVEAFTGNIARHELRAWGR